MDRKDISMRSLGHDDHYNFGCTFSSELPRADKKSSTDLYSFYGLGKNKRIGSSEEFFFFPALISSEEYHVLINSKCSLFGHLLC